MPIYKWSCVKCEAAVEVIRRVSEIDEQPTEEEDGESNCVCDEPDWQRDISMTLPHRNLTYGSKGNW